MTDKKELAVKTELQLAEVKQSITMQDLKSYFCPNATDKELYIALQVVNKCKLNPFLKQVYFIKYGSTPLQIVTDYKEYIKRAGNKLNGWNVKIVDNKKAVCTIYRKDWNEPFIWEVILSEFNKNQSTWKVMPSFMGMKVAISQAFRLAFPEELSDMPYTTEEVESYIQPIKHNEELPEKKTFIVSDDGDITQKDIEAVQLEAINKSEELL